MNWVFGFSTGSGSPRTNPSSAALTEAAKELGDRPAQLTFELNPLAGKLKTTPASIEEQLSDLSCSRTCTNGTGRMRTIPLDTSTDFEPEPSSKTDRKRSREHGVRLVAFWATWTVGASRVQTLRLVQTADKLLDMGRIGSGFEKTPAILPRR